MRRKRKFGKSFLSLALSSALVVGSAGFLSGCGSKGKSSSDEPIQLTVFSMLANYSGKQAGWGADVFKDKFNVELNYVQPDAGAFATRMESEDLGDIVIFGNDSNEYVQAVEAGALFDWNEDDLLDEYGADIKKYMPDALEKNKKLTKKITNGKSDTLYGFGGNVAASAEDHASFLYTWDIRWDLYKKLGYPEINDLDDMRQLFKDMQKICPKDDSGNKTYAVSLWPDWDDAMVMYIKAAATAYYGYDELGIGLYDPATGTYHGALEKDGPYLKMLQFFNKLYQDGLLDPDSMTQTIDQVGEKVRSGGVFFSIFNYSGSLVYNSKEHKESGRLMYSLKPKEASPIVYGMNTQGNDHIWTIGANTEYPEKAMEVINYLSTPEGYMTMQYGPKGECWDYDENGNTYFTDLGAKCNANQKTSMGKLHKGTYADGMIQLNNTTWSIDAENLDSAKGETFNKETWKNVIEGDLTEIEKDWHTKTGCGTINEYMEIGKYTVSPGTSYSKSRQDDNLKVTWSQVTDCIKNNSWKAIYAKTDAQFEEKVEEMIKKAGEYGYEECLAWSEKEAAARYDLELEVTGQKK